MAEEQPRRAPEGSDTSEDEGVAHPAHLHDAGGGEEGDEDLAPHERGGAAHNVPAEQRRKKRKRPVVLPGDVVPLDPQMEVCGASTGGGTEGSRCDAPCAPLARRSWQLWGRRVPK